MGRAAVSYRAVPEWYDLYEAQDVRRDNGYRKAQLDME